MTRRKLNTSEFHDYMPHDYEKNEDFEYWTLVSKSKFSFYTGMIFNIFNHRLWQIGWEIRYIVSYNLDGPVCDKNAMDGILGYLEYFGVYGESFIKDFESLHLRSDGDLERTNIPTELMKRHDGCVFDRWCVRRGGCAFIFHKMTEEQKMEREILHGLHLDETDIHVLKGSRNVKINK